MSYVDFFFFFFCINFFKKIFQEYHRSVKQSGSRSGPTVIRLNLGFNQYLCTYFCQSGTTVFCSSWIRRHGRAADIISWSISTKVMWPHWGSNLRPLDLQSDVLPNALWSPAHLWRNQEKYQFVLLLLKSSFILELCKFPVYQNVASDQGLHCLPLIKQFTSELVQTSGQVL